MVCTSPLCGYFRSREFEERKTYAMPHLFARLTARACPLGSVVLATVLLAG